MNKVAERMKKEGLNPDDINFESRIDRNNKSYYFDKKTNKFESIGTQGKLSKEDIDRIKKFYKEVK